MSYDYIVVGDGTAGCLAAGRLAGEHGARVLVLRSGPSDRNPLIRMPAGFEKVLGVEKHISFYKSVAHQRLSGRAPIVPQGRVLGGDSVNAVVYMRGQPGDHDVWTQETGDEQWSYDALPPYHTSMEDNDRLNDACHGVGGPSKVSDLDHICDLSQAFVLFPARSNGCGGAGKHGFYAYMEKQAVYIQHG